MNATDKVILQAGQELKLTGSRQTGFMGNDDVDEYDILSADGAVCGKVTITTHMSVKAPFHQSTRIQQYDADGKQVQDTHFKPDV